MGNRLAGISLLESFLDFRQKKKALHRVLDRRIVRKVLGNLEN